MLTAVRLGGDAASLAAAHYNLGAVLKQSGRLEEVRESYPSSESKRTGLLRPRTARAPLANNEDDILCLGSNREGPLADLKTCIGTLDPRNLSRTSKFVVYSWGGLLHGDRFNLIE